MMSFFNLLLLLFLFLCHHHEVEGSTTSLRHQRKEEHVTTTNSSILSSIEETQQAHLLSLAKRMIPRNLDTGNSTHPASPAQFFHLHHMKSGGTSLSNWIGCAKSRLEQQQQQEQQQQENRSIRIPLTGLSECSWSSYHHCIKNENDSCRKRIESAAMMNYCSPLAVTNYFNWTHADAVTMMRHPVHRVWSMFRFQTNSCFKCTNLTQVYEDINSGNIEKYGGGVCLAQLSNHITRNLLKNINVHDLDKAQLDEHEMLTDAIDSIRNRFTVVGIMERLEESIQMFGFSFPWLSEEMEGTDKVCKFPHENSSPSNNRCGPGRTHWELPSDPDEETRRAIEEHNQLDIKVYEAALEQFELQKEAMLLAESIQ